jgi:hypothetical protein
VQDAVLVLPAVALAVVIGGVARSQERADAPSSPPVTAAEEPGPTDRPPATSDITFGESAEDGLRILAPSTVVMALPETALPMERARVEFDHAAHTSALEERGCEECHSITEDGLQPNLKATSDIADRERLVDAYHETCMGCHKERDEEGLASGPVTCGECHVRRPPGVLRHAEVRFDYSLHGRHAQAYPEKCEPCHHVYDEELDKLVYEKGAEDACAACHGEEQVDDTPSLRTASHVDCVGCHLERSSQQVEAGPVLCVGCHTAERIRQIERLDPVPRLLRGQADTMWVHTAGTTARLVPFDHLAHERNSSSCSQCHHAGITKCGDCHTLVSGAKGGGVVLERAHHDASSTYSCVGCHARTAGAKECNGCHFALPSPPGKDACGRCHSGQVVRDEDRELPPPSVVVTELATLPPSSDDFPEDLQIDVVSGLREIALERLADLYGPAKMPHRKIVESLDREARKSGLAVHFHSEVERLCAGCHHHTPVGVRPPTCRSCHGAAASPTQDRPGLYVAYHRQCIGCHQEMQIEEQGCEDCHAAREGRS